MPLTLQLAPAAGRPGGETRTLSRGTLSIGRASGNDWVLEDPERLLSKTHCVIAVRAGRYFLTDLSSNGVFVNGSPQRVPRDSEIELTDGDEVRLGEYVIALAEAYAPPGPAAPQPAATRHSGGDGRSAADDPFAADPLEDPFAAPRPGFTHPLTAPPASVLRTHDPFDLADEAMPARRLDAEVDLFRGQAPGEEWRGPSQADDVDAPLQAFTAPRPIVPAALNELDIDAWLGDTPPEPARVAEPLSAASPSPPAAASPPLPPPPPAAQPPARARADAPPPPAQGEPDAARLLSAFLEGAGVPQAQLAADPEAAMRAAGEVFRAMVEGIREVLMSRASVKSEFRVEQTMLRAQDNNPLKFSLTTEDAVAALLGPKRPGYQAPLAAAREAYEDVRSHEIAVMGAVQLALLGLLRRFEPEALEQRLQRGLLDGILPGARRARTWELFRATYGEIAGEASDDFQAVFGREFARAYDAQMRKL